MIRLRALKTTLADLRQIRFLRTQPAASASAAAQAHVHSSEQPQSKIRLVQKSVSQQQSASQQPSVADELKKESQKESQKNSQKESQKNSQKDSSQSQPFKTKSEPTWSLPPIFTKQNSNEAAVADSSLLLDYPWLLSTAPSREASPTFWQALKQKSMLASAVDRTRRLLKFPAYDFPNQFLQDAAQTAAATLAALSDPSVAASADALRPLMVRGLTQLFVPGFDALREKGLMPLFVVHAGGDHGPLPSVPVSVSKVLKSLTTPMPIHASMLAQTHRSKSVAKTTQTEFESNQPLPAAQNTPPMRVRIKNIHLTYGPYPPPSDFVAQDWFDFLRYVIPASDATFESHPRQREIIDAAEKDGVYIRITVSIDVNLEFILLDTVSGIPVLRDRRSRIEMQFVSPHFTKYDEIFVAEGDAKDYRLLWDWRVSDIDGLLQKRTNVI